MDRKIMSVLVWPYQDKVVVKITRQANFNNVTSGIMVRYYTAWRRDLKNIKRLLKRAGQINSLIYLRMADYYV